METHSDNLPQVRGLPVRLMMVATAAMKGEFSLHYVFQSSGECRVCACRSAECKLLDSAFL